MRRMWWVSTATQLLFVAGLRTAIQLGGEGALILRDDNGQPAGKALYVVRNGKATKSVWW